MKLTPVNNTNFGYNIALNRELVKRLKKERFNDLYITALELNKTCNNLEDRIVRLEGYERGSIKAKETIIGTLSGYFIELKSQLCDLVDDLFPDLCFTEEECAHYEEEAQKFDLPEEADGDNGPKDAYIWRETLVDGLQMKIMGEDAPYYTDKHDSPKKAKAGSVKNENAGGLLEKYEIKKNSPKSLDDVVGLKDIIEDVNDLIVLPLTDPLEAQKREDEYGILTPHFIIMYGPPGCGKTMTSEAIKAQTGCEMYKLDISRAGSSFVNESSVNITKAFDFLKKRAQKSDKPILLFMDEMDAMLTARREATGGDKEDNKIVDTLLQHIADAQDNNIIVIGATNMYSLVDPAIKDRAKLELYVGLPNDEERMELITRELTKFKMGVELARHEEEINMLSEKLRPYSPRSIKAIIEGASRIAWKQGRELIAQDVIDAIERTGKEQIDEDDYKTNNKNTSAAIGFRI